MANLDDIGNQYEMIFCTRCYEEWPAMDFDVHDEFCRKFLRLVSQGASANVVEDALTSGFVPHDFQGVDIDSDDDTAYEDTLCNICYNNFPKISMAEHVATTHGGVENKNQVQEPKNARNELPKAENKPAPNQDKDIRRNQEVRNLDQRQQKAENKPDSNQSKDIPRVIIKEKRVCNQEQKKAENKSAPNQDKDIFREQKPREKPETNGRKNNVEPSNVPPKEPTKPHGMEREKKTLFDESRTFQIPHNPLLDCIDQTEDEDLNKISDDEGAECLEDFWRRAQESIQRQKRQNV